MLNDLRAAEPALRWSCGMLGGAKAAARNPARLVYPPRAAEPAGAAEAEPRPFAPPEVRCPQKAPSGSAAGVLNCIATGGEFIGRIGRLAPFSARACAITAR
jgi:hypothetical protein